MWKDEPAKKLNDEKRGTVEEDDQRRPARTWRRGCDGLTVVPTCFFASRTFVF